MVELRAFDLCRSLSSCCAERLYQLGAGLLYADDGAAETLQICTGLHLPQRKASASTTQSDLQVDYSLGICRLSSN